MWIRCTISADGGMQNCVVVEQSPPSADFASAAGALGRLFRIGPRTRGGRPTAGLVIVQRIDF